mmetsp:Transcript_16929/g.47515  ORF Transcript_16929/g.47515 Transcript_16929/m.47515 type:complete len:98 (-) Transcript_16929:69-362(-)
MSLSVVFSLVSNATTQGTAAMIAVVLLYHWKNYVVAPADLHHTTKDKPYTYYYCYCPNNKRERCNLFELHLFIIPNTCMASTLGSYASIHSFTPCSS